MVIDKISTILELHRSIVGVKFIFSQEEFDALGTKQVKHKMSYCNTVRLATKGYSFKASADNFLCNASARALGTLDINNRVVSGQEYHSYNMYNSLGIAKYVQQNVTYINHEIYGVQVMPLSNYDKNPDVVIMVLNPYQAMRVVQGYTYHKGVAKNVKFTGNQGLCSECTATPYENNDLNVSLLCANTRFATDWKDDEMGIGMPYHQFEVVADGIIKTVEPSDSDERKEKMIERLQQKGLEVKVKLGTSYYKD